MPRYRLAQLNIAKARQPFDSPAMADFRANRTHINALAEQASGFVWRLAEGEADVGAARVFGENIHANLSVWDDVASLQRYAFLSAHAALIRRRRDWFEPPSGASLVLWWIPHDHVPTLEEAAVRLQHLRDHGATAKAFTFKEAVRPPADAE